MCRFDQTQGKLFVAVLYDVYSVISIGLTALLFEPTFSLR
jgi:hypothetical protein